MAMRIPTCREIAEFLDDYVSGEMAAQLRAEFDYHLELCPNCRRYLASYRETIKLGRRAFDDESAPAETAVPEDLIQAILAAQRKD